MIKLHECLPHDLIQVEYKILWLYSKKYVYFDFFDEHNKNDSFEWVLVEKWPWSLI